MAIRRRKTAAIADEASSKKKKHKVVSALRPNNGILHPTTKQGCIILSIAICIGWLLNNREIVIPATKKGSENPLVSLLWRHVCSNGILCHKHQEILSTTQPTVLIAGRQQIRKGETVLRVPRYWQIWDIDAFADNLVVQNEFLGHALPAAAYLAAHLAMLGKCHDSPQSSFCEKVFVSPVVQEKYRGLKVYLDALPTTYHHHHSLEHNDDGQELLFSHPILWSDQGLRDRLGPYSSTVAHVRAFQWQFQEEYEAFCSTSHNFCQHITRHQYNVARLHVMTRSFGTGPIPHDEKLLSIPALESMHAAGLSTENGFHAMVPILDMYNHHANPNVGFVYEQDAFVIRALRHIAPGQEVLDSYGKRTDTDLFARYGFVNGDGSEHTQATLALWHSIPHAAVLFDAHSTIVRNATTVAHAWTFRERLQIARYLQYDDGYEHCVEPNNDMEAWTFKKLKLQYLLRIVASRASSWVFYMSPRRQDATPPTRTSTTDPWEAPPSLDLGRIQFDGNESFATCRLLSLTHKDYGGEAMRMLQTALDADRTEQVQNWLPPTKDALEYRTLLCVARMASTALHRFGGNVAQLQKEIATLPAKSLNWTVAHLRLGEMESLDVLKQVAFSGLRRLYGSDAIQMGQSDVAYRMRDNPCSPAIVKTLVEQVALD